MERQDSNNLQNTPRRTAPVRRPRPQRRPGANADTKEKVSALFTEQDSEESKFAIPEADSEVKPEAKPEAKRKPEAKPEANLEAKRKPEAKPEVKPEAKRKPEAKPEANLEAKRKPEPETTQAEAKEKPENLEPESAVPVEAELAKDEPEPAKEKQKKKSAFTIILTIIIIIAACGLAFSGYKLFTILHGYKEGSDAYKEVERQIIPAPSTKPEKKEEEEVPFSVDMEALKNINPDGKGYLYCKGLMSYPVVQCTDNDYYLTHLFNGEWNSCGCLFIDCNTPDAFEARNCIIYGHNMNDGSMFASLYNYDDEDFYKTHKEFDVFTEGHHYIYKVFSLFVTPVDGFVYTTNFANDEDFVNFLNVAAGYCPYDTEYGELTPDRKVITLSTCLGNDDETQRFVVMLIRDREVTE